VIRTGIFLGLLVVLPAASYASESALLRAPDGRRLIRAARATAAVTIDGQLDDAVWLAAEATGEFTQSDPRPGDPASEPTDVRIAYDEQNLYIAAYCHDSDPAALIVSEIRKDFEPAEQDTFEVLIDTFGDRRNGYIFMTNVEGARADQQVANEGRETNPSWDAVWFVRTRRVEDGWIAEMAIPFRSLQFKTGAGESWGINFSRRVRRKNEITFWSPIGREYALSRVSLAGVIGDLAPANAGRNLRVKPYALTQAVRSTGGEAFDNDVNVGFDAKYGLTPALTLDVTVHPDFAQVEADEQDVNLTQFSQFFPEKREFFLENSGIFYVGDADRMRSVPTPTPDEDMLLFFSRRIGLTPDGTPIPITGGARLTGRHAGFSLGLLSMHARRTDATPANLYTVARLRRNIAQGSDIGAFFMSRESTDRHADSNRVFGVDGNWRMFNRLDWNMYSARTATPGVRKGQYVARTSLNWEDSFFHGKGSLLAIGEGFRSDLAFYRRTGVRKWVIDTGIRPRFQALRRWRIRELHPHVRPTYITDLHNRAIAKPLHQGNQVIFNNGAEVEMSFNSDFQAITKPFSLARGTPEIPAGEYGWSERNLRILSDQSRAIAFNGSFVDGGLWSGRQRGFNATVTMRLSYRFRVRTSIQRRYITLDLPKAEFTTSVYSVRTNYSFSPNMFLDSLLQYNRNQDLFNANVRFNFIHRPLSDFFIVYNEQRFVDDGTIPAGRGIIVKFTQMMAF
jgi:hypothetical protein